MSSAISSTVNRDGSTPTALTLIRRLWWRLRRRISERWRMMSRGGPRRVMYVCDLSDHRPPTVQRSDIEFVELPPEELRRQPQRFGATIALGVGEIRTGTGCIVGRLQGRVVYHAWYVRADGASMHGLPVNWRPRGRVLFLHDGVTDPELRGRGIHTSATHWLLARERGSDVAQAVCVVHADNVAASRAVERAGFRRLGRID